MSSAQQKRRPDPLPTGVISTKQEEKLVQERVAIGAPVVYETIWREGEDELRRPAAALAWSGLAVGLSMGISFVTEALLAASPSSGLDAVSFARRLFNRIFDCCAGASAIVHGKHADCDSSAHGPKGFTDIRARLEAVGCGVVRESSWHISVRSMCCQGSAF